MTWSLKLAVVMICMLNFLRAITIFLFIISNNSCTERNTDHFPDNRIPGVFNLSHIDFSASDPVKLEGKWNFYWKKLLFQKDFSQGFPEEGSAQSVADIWNDYEVNGEKIGSEGFATFQARIETGRVLENIAFSLLHSGSNYRLYLDDRLIMASGKVGTDDNEAQPSWKPQVAIVKRVPASFNLIIQVSNYSNHNGGFFYPLEMASIEKMNAYFIRSFALELFLIGSLIIIAIYHFTLFFLRRKEWAMFYFSMFAMIAALRILLTGGKFIYQLWPSFPWIVQLKVEYLTFYTMGPMFFLFMRDIYPRFFPKRITKLVFAVFIPGVISVILLPPSIYTMFLFIFQIATIAGALYIIIAVMKATLYKEPGSKLVLIGFGIFFLTVVNDILYADHYIHTGYISSLGIFAFVVSHAIMLSTNYASAFNQLEELSYSLELKVNERTRELQDSSLALEEKEQKVRDLLNEIKKDLALAKNIQRSFLSKSIEPVDNFSFHFYYQPLYDIGGDIYNLHRLDDTHIRILLADAIGHGIPAALITMLIKGEYDRVKDQVEHPHEIFQILNKKFSHDYRHLQVFFTGIVMDINLSTREMRYTSAGHPDQILIHNDHLELLKRSGRGVGLVSEGNYLTRNLYLEKDAKILLFTDGIFEEFNLRKEAFGEERLFRLVKELRDREVVDILEDILLNLKVFMQKSVYNDDLTILGIEVN